MDLDLTVDDCSIKPGTMRTVSVCLSGVDIGAILDQIKVEDVVAHYRATDLLDAIGEDDAKNMWDLYSKDDISKFDAEFIFDR